MKIIHVCHPTTGFSEADLRDAHRIQKTIKDKQYLIFVGGFSAFNAAIGTNSDEELKDSTVLYIESGIPEEVWVFGAVDVLMKKEIEAAIAQKMPIVPMNKEASASLKDLNISIPEDRSVFRFWMLFGVIALISSIAFYIILSYADTLAK